MANSKKILTPHNHCFGCGKENPQSMRLKFTYDEQTRQVASTFRLGKRYSGPPGYCHGGIIATILDEAMAKLNKPNLVTAVTAHMAVDYLKPVPLNKRLRAQAHETWSADRRRFREAVILNEEGTVLARAQGIFITVDPRKMLGRSV
ncbi:MAG TPA: PaaI family thioesterase [Terriglobales bacterium]|nr:PaaI family thioesterase [Terriglobales bacterium]